MSYFIIIMPARQHTGFTVISPDASIVTSLGSMCLFISERSGLWPRTSQQSPSDPPLRPPAPGPVTIQQSGLYLCRSVSVCPSFHRYQCSRSMLRPLNRMLPPRSPPQSVGLFVSVDGRTNWKDTRTVDREMVILLVEGKFRTVCHGRHDRQGGWGDQGSYRVLLKGTCAFLFFPCSFLWKVLFCKKKVFFTILSFLFALFPVKSLYDPWMIRRVHWSFRNDVQCS